MLDDEYIKEMVVEKRRKLIELDNEYLEKIYKHIEVNYINKLPYEVGDKVVELDDLAVAKIVSISPNQKWENGFEVSIGLKSKEWSCWTNEQDILTDFVPYKDFKNKTPEYIKSLEEYRKKNK
jgi:hypothetical protein